MARVCQRCNHSNLTEAKFCLQCGAMLEADAEDGGDPLIGKILMGRYRVSKVLGEGGMGKVYLAEQKMGTAVRKVAIKTLHRELGGDPQLVARFHRECETVIELHHPNTVQFYDFGEMEDKTLFIVMEFIEGEDLSHVLQRGALDLTRADRILIQVCGSLNEAHACGIVHRDLKPENVLLTQRGGQSDFVKVLDFGIAKRNEAEDASKAKLTKQGTVLGTPPYMSPEQFSGQALDLRSDIYSLGVMTYEMVTGQLPFEGRTPWEWATKHLTQPPAPLESHPGGAALPPNKRNAIMRALAKNRDERYGSVIEFMQEFTGMVDPQAAWTMATSAGMKGVGISSQQVAQAMGGVGPNAPTGAMGAAAMGVAHTQASQVMHPSQPGYGSTPSYAPYGQTSGSGAHPVQPMTTPSQGQVATPFGSNPGFPQPIPSGGGGLGKVFAVIGVLAVLAIGSVGLYFVFGPKPALTAATGTTVPGTTGTTGVGTGINGVGINGVGTGVNGVGTPIGTTGTTGSLATTGTTGTTGVPTPIGVDPNARDAGTTATLTGSTTGTTGTTGTLPPNTDATGATMITTPAMTDAPAADQPSPADLERGRAAARDADAAIGRSDLEGAVRSLAAAQHAVGRSHAIAAAPRANLARIGGRMVGIMIQQNKCPAAQALYRQLRSVGADSGARSQFVPGYCDRP
jgi:tRNA A-37 threonylcarbamoyl transferase component Bud32